MRLISIINFQKENLESSVKKLVISWNMKLNLFNFSEANIPAIRHSFEVCIDLSIDKISAEKNSCWNLASPKKKKQSKIFYWNTLLGKGLT